MIKQIGAPGGWTFLLTVKKGDWMEGTFVSFAETGSPR